MRWQTSGMRIGLLVARSGPAGLWAPTSEACTMLAAAELNAAGGVADRAVTLTVADAGMDDATGRRAASRLLDERVDAVIGMHPSYVRGGIAAELAGRVPYVYAPMYEGGETSRAVLPIGSTDAELLGHAIPRLMSRRQANRFFIVGNDYVWPRRGTLSAARIVAAHGGRIAGVKLVPFGQADHPSVLDALRRSGADLVITLLLGAETIAFCRAFAAAGLDRAILRLCLATDEIVLYGAGAECHENLYTVTTYTADQAGSRHERFRELYRNCFGTTMPAATVFGQACYDGVHLLASLAQSAGRGPDRGRLYRRFVSLAGIAAHHEALVATIGAPPRQIQLTQADGLSLRPYC